MTKKIKTGTLEIPDAEFDESNMTAHISIRLPLSLVKDLKRLSLTDEYQGKYQVLMREILTHWTESQKAPKKKSIKKKTRVS